MRYWNQAEESGSEQAEGGLDPTYEVLKQDKLCFESSRIGQAWSYLWGIETLNLFVVHLEAKTRLDPTYEVLKHDLNTRPCFTNERLDPTYEVLKLELISLTSW